MKKIIKIILLIIFIFLFLGQVIFSIKMTHKAKKARDMAIMQQKIAVESREEAERQRAYAIEQQKVVEDLQNEVNELREKLKNCQE